MRDKMVQYQEQYKTPFNLESSPAEGTAYKLAQIDVERYKNIITAGTKESPYYTNSSNISVKSMGDLFSDLSHQNELQPLYTGGTVFHMYMGEKLDDYESVKILLKKICNNFKIPYISFTPTFSICPRCGYISGEHETCPNCIEVES
jgi:ribonucleoside-triphosphate reductase